MKPPIVILTGAGISAESGLKTFRDSNGLWEGHQVEDIATPTAFGRNAPLVHDFYNKRHNVHTLCETTLKENGKHFVKLSGSWENRFETAVEAIEDLFRK